jgi:hypothetical protein
MFLPSSAMSWGYHTNFPPYKDARQNRLPPLPQNDDGTDNDDAAADDDANDDTTSQMMMHLTMMHLRVILVIGEAT